MLLSHLLRHLVRRGTLRLTDARGELHVFSGDPGPNISVRLHDPKLERDLFFNPRLRLGEAFMDGTLTVDAELMVPTPAGLRLQHGEVRHPHFSRTFVLSPDFDASRIDAQLRDGVLKLTIPRRDEAKPRRIEVQAG